MKTCIAAAAMLAATAGAGNAAASHCAADEAIWFNAAVKGTSKIVSLCGSKSLENNNAWLEYRFGKPGDVELQFPSDRHGSLRAFTVRRFTRPGTTYLKLEFDNGGYNYAILDYYEVGADPESETLLRVRRKSDGEDVASFDLAIDGESLGIMRLEDRVRTEPFDE